MISNDENLLTETVLSDAASPNFKPQLLPEFQQQFWDAVHAAAFQAPTAQVKIINDAVEKICWRRETTKARVDEHQYEGLTRNIAALLLLRDLIQMGWTLNLLGPGRISLERSTLRNSLGEAKEQIRASMDGERIESLQAQSVKDFIYAIERQRMWEGSERSIFSLIAGGEQLSGVLNLAKTLPHEEQIGTLQDAIKPYLHLVEGEKRDEFTGLRLIDIWRYFRLTWSTPYRPTPGRNLFYLIRDAGQPCHPVVGIAALANCVIGLKSRDDRIGWTPDAIADKLLQAQQHGHDAFRQEVADIAEMLNRHLETGVAAIAIEGITSQNNVMYPTEEVVAEVWKVAQDAAEKRYEHLREEILMESDPELELVSPLDQSNSGVARENRASSAALYRRKRASKLASLLQAKLIFETKNAFDDPEYGIPALLWSDSDRKIRNETGRSAMRVILNANKDSKIGSSMMEIIVCGAIPPYNYLLGGKLVSMLLTSPEVVRDYEQRYGAQPSTIASQVAGRNITRAAHLVFLGTSSLYVGDLDKSRFKKAQENGEKTPHPVSASQYNRVRIPAHIEERPGEIKYECIGMTEGYGVIHFSTDTREALEELDVITQKMRRVNSMFGEGTSPRMRKIRQGISLLGLSDEFLVHGQARLVYAINLAHNTERYLVGNDEAPDYILPQDHPRESSDRIAHHWIERWLTSRLKHNPSLEKVAGFVPRDFAVSLAYHSDEHIKPLNLNL